VKAIVISSERLRREAQVFMLCVVSALCVNALSIAYYETSWVELITSFPITFLLSIVAYLSSLVVRGLSTFFFRRRDSA